ncbi:MAG: hypothetical protein PF448_08780 [Bacteroidales bacterium]|jgi:hypothetical protein|nr:hypothetical protein [Bacteroidales bacterium]
MVVLAGLTAALGGVFKFLNYRQQMDAAQTAAEYELLARAQQQQTLKIIIMGSVMVMMIVVIGWVLTSKMKNK